MRCSEFWRFSPGLVGSYETLSGVDKVASEKELHEDLSNFEVPIGILDRQVKK